MNNPRITISMPVYLRPRRTARAIQCILNQTVQDWEAFILGDGCPDFYKIPGICTTSGRICFHPDRRLNLQNFRNNTGGCGYRQTNFAINNARGKYFLFFANDDVISPVHMATYLDGIEDTPYDFMYYDYLAFGRRMVTKMKYGHIGHSALIIRTDFLQQMPPHGPEYGHDFDLIKNMIRAGARYRKGEITPTYYVMSGNRQRLDPEGID